jgi:hypothetical protein
MHAIQNEDATKQAPPEPVYFYDWNHRNTLRVVKRQCLLLLDRLGSLEQEYFNENASRSRPFLSIEKEAGGMVSSLFRLIEDPTNE